MSRKSGNAARFFRRFFKERQIYHRSDGVVHFISMSTQTQVLLATVVSAALMWVAYASVNVVFKEQIIVSKERKERVQRDNYERKLEQSRRAYDDISTLNLVFQAQFNEAMNEIAGRHETLKSMVDRKSAVDETVQKLTQGLSEAGSPSGQRPTTSNRVMIDPAPAEPTRRRSRMSALLREAKQEALASIEQTAEKSGGVSPSMNKLNAASEQLFSEQTLLLARLEEVSEKKISELRAVLSNAGIDPDRLITPPKIRNDVLAQGGPFIDADNVSSASTKFFRRSNRTSLMIQELDQLTSIVDTLPLSSPIIVSRRQTSGFGYRRDPFHGRAARHYGLDFAARWAAPVVATAPGQVKFAGVRSGFGRLVEIDHGNGFVTRYAHLNKFVVKRGQRVDLHQKIGELGNSGRSTGPHVHYEIVHRGKPKDPEKFIEAGRYVFES
ncbi:MAG: peptidoglycan DD-metalloendopeptidase family protein [Pseudomonadota bacterium]